LTVVDAKDSEFLADLHRQADERLASGDPQGARQIWEAILQIDPDDARARERLESTPPSHRSRTQSSAR